MLSFPSRGWRDGSGRRLLPRASSIRADNVDARTSRGACPSHSSEPGSSVTTASAWLQSFSSPVNVDMGLAGLEASPVPASTLAPWAHPWHCLHSRGPSLACPEPLGQAALPWAAPHLLCRGQSPGSLFFLSPREPYRVSWYLTLPLSSQGIIPCMKPPLFNLLCRF